MRQCFPAQPDIHLLPIEKIVLPRHSRDELPPILAGKRATGRTGMDLWQILVLGVVRLGLDADWDRLEHVANYDLLVRQMLGLPATPWGTAAKVFARQTLRDNVASSMTRCSKTSTPAWPPPVARCLSPKPARPRRRWRSKWTPTCWKPTSTSPPI